MDPESSKMLKKEYEGYLGLIFKILFQIFVTTCIILVDRLFFESLEVIAEHSAVNFSQEGVHDVNIKVSFLLISSFIPLQMTSSFR